MGLWRGLFSPTPILPLTWWWDFHYGQGDFVHFTRVSEFLGTMPDKGPVPEAVTVQAPADLEAMGLRIGSDVFLWLHNKRSSTQVRPVVTVPGMSRPEYLRSTFEPWSGTSTSAVQARPEGGILRIEVPDLGADKEIAYRIVDPNPLAVGNRKVTHHGEEIRIVSGRLEIVLPGNFSLAGRETMAYRIMDSKGKVASAGKSRLGAHASGSPAASFDITGISPGVCHLRMELGSNVLWRRLVIP